MGLIILDLQVFALEAENREIIKHPLVRSDIYTFYAQ